MTSTRDRLILDPRGRPEQTMNRAMLVAALVLSLLASRVSAQEPTRPPGAPCGGPRAPTTAPVLRVGQRIRAQFDEVEERTEGPIFDCTARFLWVDAVPDSLSVIDLNQPMLLEVRVGDDEEVPPRAALGLRGRGRGGFHRLPGHRFLRGGEGVRVQRLRSRRRGASGSRASSSHRCWAATEGMPRPNGCP